MLLYPPEKIKEADYIILESTYGDRIHSTGDVKAELLKIIQETFDRKGILMIPSFAVERTQEWSPRKRIHWSRTSRRRKRDSILGKSRR